MEAKDMEDNIAITFEPHDNRPKKKIAECSQNLHYPSPTT